MEFTFSNSSVVNSNSVDKLYVPVNNVEDIPDSVVDVSSGALGEL